jgi:hypothetical protein
MTSPLAWCHRFLLPLVAASCLMGCVATSAHMENNEGAEVDCSKWGVGFIFAPLALVRSTNCVKVLQEAGYHKVDANAPVASAPQPAADAAKP